MHMIFLFIVVRNVVSIILGYVLEGMEYLKENVYVDQYFH